MRNLETISSGQITSANAVEQIERLQRAVETVIKGKPEAIRLAIVTLIASGHLLVEDVPGVGKTTLAHALARALDRADVRRLFDGAEHPDVTPRVPADVAELLLRQVEAAGAGLHPLGQRDQRRRQPAALVGGLLQQVVREPQRRLAADARQRDEPLPGFPQRKRSEEPQVPRAAGGAAGP